MPRAYHPMVDLVPDDELARMTDGTRALLERCVSTMPSHEDFIAQNCAAAKVAVA